MKVIIKDRLVAKRVSEFLREKCARDSNFAHVTCGWEFGRFTVRDDANGSFALAGLKEVMGI